jgi:hypothetical protein
VDKAEGAAQEVMVADALALMEAVVAPAVMAEVVTAEVVMAEDVMAEDVMAVAAGAEVEDLEWEEAVCQDLDKMVPRKQKRKSGMQAYLIP